MSPSSSTFIGKVAKRLSLRGIVARTMFTILAVVAWFKTQSLIEAGRGLGDGIADLPMLLLEPVSEYLRNNPSVSNALLLISSFILDCLVAFMFYRTIFGNSVKPLVAILIKFIMRQCSTVMVSLPIPENMIWYQPSVCGWKVPSLVCYHTSTDFFFSGHTSMAVLGMLELFSLDNAPLALFGICIAIFEALTVLVLRAHYTMDVVTGILAAFVAAQAASKLSPPCDKVLEWLAPRWVPKDQAGRSSIFRTLFPGIIGAGIALIAGVALVVKVAQADAVALLSHPVVEQFQLVAIFQYALLWLSMAALFKIVSKYIPTKKPTDLECVTHAVTIMHSLFCTFYGFLWINWRGRVPDHFGDPTTDAQKLLFKVMGGYFLYDFFICLYVEIVEQGKRWAEISWAVILVHHVSAFSMVVYFVGAPANGLYIAFLVPYFEWTSPFLSSTWIMHFHGIDKLYPLVTIILKVIMALLWTIGRLFVLNYVYYQGFLSEHGTLGVNAGVKIFATLLVAVSMYWQYKIFKFVGAAIFPRHIKVTEKSVGSFVVDGEGQTKEE